MSEAVAVGDGYILHLSPEEANLVSTTQFRLIEGVGEERDQWNGIGRVLRGAGAKVDKSLRLEGKIVAGEMPRI